MRFLQVRFQDGPWWFTRAWLRADTSDRVKHVPRQVICEAKHREGMAWLRADTSDRVKHVPRQVICEAYTSGWFLHLSGSILTEIFRLRSG